MTKEITSKPRSFRNVLSIGADAKTSKGEKIGIMTGILYLIPFTGFDGKRNLCPNASKLCGQLCLVSSGKGGLPSVIAARTEKTRRLLNERQSFLSDLEQSVAFVKRKAKRERLLPAIRLNGTSDLPFEYMADSRAIMEANADVQFYDYTKSPRRMEKFLAGEAPRNYHVTFSRSESNGPVCRQILSKGGNIATVFSKELYAVVVASGNYDGIPVVDGDTSDARFLDGVSGSIVALKAKGKARGYQPGGFVIFAPGQFDLVADTTPATPATTTTTNAAL